MVAHAHIAQYIEDNYALFAIERRAWILARICGTPNPMNASWAEKILGQEDAGKLFSLLGADARYIQLSLDDVERRRNQSN